MNDKKTKRFRLFDFNRDGKGVSKDEIVGPPNLKNFFKTFFRKFSKLLSVNLMMLFRLPTMVLVLFIASSMLIGFPIFNVIYSVIISLLGASVPAAESELLAPIHGMYIASGSFESGSFVSSSVSLQQMMQNYGGIIDAPTYSIAYYAVIGSLALFTLVTWGWQNVGSAYLTRNMVRGDAVFVWSDYFRSIKKNLKQGFFMGVIDSIIMVVLVVDVCHMLTTSGEDFMSQMMLFLVIGLSVLYLIMRKYIYLMLITFDMSVWKMFKNALIFTTLGLKRNAMAFLGKAVITVINLALVLILLPMNIVVPLVLPLVYYLATSAYISAYAYYPVIEKYMITPYQN
ncbi:MAG: YesL family protein [Clostridia bacterium]|nr:YesL family protein [Clostridia bacterium]